MAAVTIVGVGLDGCAGMTSAAVNAVSRSQVLFGAPRLLEVFPQFEGRRVLLKGKLFEVLDEVHELAIENDVCLLASGDPLFFGIAGLAYRKLGSENLRIIPNVSSMQLAFSAAGVAWSRAGLFSVHGRELFGLVSRLSEVSAAGILTDAESHPAGIASHLEEFLGPQVGDWRAWVCEELGALDQRIRTFDDLRDLAKLEGASFADLNVLILERKDRDWRPRAALGYVTEENFARRMPKKGLITKREIRALTLANLRLRRDAIFWDIGTASGSVAIEAARLAPEGRILAVEVEAKSVAIAKENVRIHGADNVEVIAGRAPEVFGELLERGQPDAVFVGGSKGSMVDIVAEAYDALAYEGRLVVNAITLESVQAALNAFRVVELEPEVTLLQISRGAKLAHYLRYEALNPIHIIAATKEAS